MKKTTLTDKQKKIFTIVTSAIQIVVVLFAIILAAIILANPNVGSAEVGKGNTKLLPVLSNSMAGDQKDSFKEGDLIIATTPADKNALMVGQIITFKSTIGGANELNTHRIVRVEHQGDKVVYFTKGDNVANEDRGYIYADEVLAVYKYHLNGIGAAINWLQQPTNFLLAVVLPLIILFIYNIIMFVRMLLIVKFNKMQEASAGIAVDEEELKRKAIEEYLAAQKTESLEVAKSTAETSAQAAEDGEDEPTNKDK